MDALKLAVLEDDEDVVVVYAHMLELEKDTDLVATFTTVAEAKEWEGWDGTDGAVIDFMLPHETGDQLASWLRDNYPDVIRILVSAYHDAPDEFEEGLFHDVVPKPFSPHTLIETVRTHRG